LVPIILAALLFGVAVAVLKGTEANLRNSVGNISAPWLLLPFLAGTTSRGPWRGAAMGAAACLTALLGFYVAEAFVLDLGDHPLMTDLTLALGAGRMYFIAGAIFGPLFGALGGTAGRRAGSGALVAGLLLLGEPVAVFAWLAGIGVGPADTGMVVAYPALWMGEMLLGLLLLFAVGLRSFCAVQSSR
jgi:hypothetical protein